MKARLKRLISLLCVVSVFASAVLSTNFLSAKAESNNGQVETLPTGMTEITFRDFGVADGDCTKWKGYQYTGETMDNTLFSGKITFPKVANASFQYGGVGAWNGGFELIVGGDATSGFYLRLHDTQNKFNYDLSDSVAGMQLVGKEIEVHFSLEYVNKDGGATNNDLKLGLWFGHKLYGNDYFYLNNYVDAAKSIGKWLTLIPKTNGPINVKSLDINRMPSDFTEINFTDFGIEDGQYSNTFSGTYEGETMDRTLFSGKLTFPTTGETHFMYGGKASWNGFILTNVYDQANDIHYLRLYDSDGDKDGKSFNDVKFYSDVAGTQLVGKEFTLNYTIEYVNNDSGATANDVKLGVWFNGKLYNNQYIYINNYVNTGHSIGTTMTFWNRLSATIALKSCNYQLPTDMTDITFSDFGFADGQHKFYPSKEYTGETLDNTLFSGKVTFPEANLSGIQYGGKVTYGGFNILATQNTNTGEWYLRVLIPIRTRVV